MRALVDKLQRVKFSRRSMLARLNKKECELWESFEKTGSIEAFLLYHSVKNKENVLRKVSDRKNRLECVPARETSKETF
jgi:hypothetical protein